MSVILARPTSRAPRPARSAACTASSGVKRSPPWGSPAFSACSEIGFWIIDATMVRQETSGSSKFTAEGAIRQPIAFLAAASCASAGVATVILPLPLGAGAAGSALSAASESRATSDSRDSRRVKGFSDWLWSDARPVSVASDSAGSSWPVAGSCRVACVLSAMGLLKAMPLRGPRTNLSGPFRRRSAESGRTA